MSRQLKNNTGERKLRVTLLSAEWKASSNGDLTTINRELAIQMAKHSNVEVSVFLPQSSEEDKRDADSYKVKLIDAVKLPGFEPVDWLASLPDGHAMDCVVGHGVALGRQIPLIKNNPNYKHCKWIQVVHTAPEEIGMYKSISEGQQMQQTVIELCEMADQVVTIGPKLTDAYKHQLRKQDVFNLMPSIFTEFSDVQQGSYERRKFCVLVTESGDSEDFDVKGYGIAAKAIANLKGEPYQLKFASKQRGKEDELKQKLLQCGIDPNQLIICSFDENRKTSANLFSMVDIAILPSKTEGFGLSALKAISAGLPVLVSGNSGIAEALREVPNGSYRIVDSEDPTDWARAIKAVCDKKRNVRLAEAKILREHYLQRFSWEESCDVLVKQMFHLAFGTSPSTLLSTSDHKRKLEVRQSTVKLQKKKGMLPLPGSSTFGPEEELEEPRMKLQRMEGNSPSTLLSTSGHKRKQEVRHSTVKLQEKKAEYSDALKESIKSHTEYLVQASPITSRVRTDDIFTNILMQHGRKPVEDPHVKRKERLRRYGQISGKQINSSQEIITPTDGKRKKRLRQYGQKSGKKIKSSQEIFIPTDGKHPKSVLVTGKAGIGKTLFCQKLIRDWADNKLFRSRANAEVPDFKFAYLLTFRQLNLLGDDPVTLKDILNRSSVLDDHSNIDDSIFEYVLHHSEEVLIIIDGYDECSQREYIASDSDEKYPNNAKEKMPVAALCAKLIKGKILRGSVVMITSRPDESDEMKAKNIYFDRYVEITGFSEPQVKEYIGKYFKNNDRMKNIVMDHITKNVNLVSFAHIPVLCFLMCFYFEYTLQQPKKNNPLPVKTSDLYDGVVNMFVRRHDRKKRASLKKTLDELSKLAAQLLLERKFLFFKEDLKTLNLHEVELILCGSGLLHCGPPFRKSFSETTKHFCFTHLTFQEYLAARWFVETRTIPPKHVSTEVVLLMSGILSKQKDNEFEEKMIIHTFLSDDLLEKEAKRGHLISKCLLRYEDIEFAKGIVKRFHDVFDIRNGSIDLSRMEDVDCPAVSFALNVLGALSEEKESEWNTITTLKLASCTVTDADVASLCQALQTPTCKVTELDLGDNQITDAGVASLCQALQTPTCKVTELYLGANQITDAGVARLCQALQTPTCKVIKLYLGFNQITDAGVASLCQALQTPTCKVTELYLSGNQIIDAGVASLCQALQTPTCKVTELYVSGNQITDAGVASLCQALQTPTCKLTELHLGANQITDAGVASLCQALQTPTCKVTELDLRGNLITDAGVASLCQALQTPTCKVTELRLGGKQITDAGVASLCQALQTPTCKVIKLSLGGNQITDAGVSSLCQALQAPTCKVTELDLDLHHITDAGVASLCQALQALTCKVTELDLDYNHIADAGVASLCQALQAPTCKVTKLDLVLNQITDAGVASLCQALQAPTCKVTELDLGYNHITDAGVASLCQALQAPTCKVKKLNMEKNHITNAAMDRLKNILGYTMNMSIANALTL